MRASAAWKYFSASSGRPRLVSSVAMPEYWVTYGVQRANVPLAVSCTAVSTVQYYPFYKAGQFVGLVNGMKGSAEYEKLVGIEQIQP